MTLSQFARRRMALALRSQSHGDAICDAIDAGTTSNVSKAIRQKLGKAMCSQGAANVVIDAIADGDALPAWVQRRLAQALGSQLAGEEITAAVNLITSAPLFPISGWQFRVTADRSYTDAGTTLATALGDYVQQINDIGGTNHVTQSGLSNRPIFVPTCPIANKPAIRLLFGRDTKLNAPSVSVNTQSFSFYTVFRPVLTGDQTYALFNFGSTTALSSPMFDWQDGNARTYLPLNNSTTHFFYGNPMVLTVVGGPSGVYVYRNNVKVTLPAYTAGTVSGGALFHRGDGYRFKGADVYEFGLIDSVLSDADVANIVSYAQSQYDVRTSWSNFFGITGDSLTEGQEDNTGLGTHLGLMMADYLGPTWKCCNAGVSAIRSNTMDTRAAYALDRQVAGVSGRKVVAFLGGTNDLGIDGLPATTLQSRVQSFITNRTAAGFNEIYIATVQKRDDGDWNASKETERQAYNTWVRAQAGTLFTGAIDLDALSAFSNPLDTTYYGTDKLHWKQAARDAALSAIKTAIGV